MTLSVHLELSVEMEVIARVDGVESTIVFVDHPSGDLEVRLQ